MSDSGNAVEVPRTGTPAPIIRSIGWLIIAILAAYLIENVLVVGYGMAGLMSGGVAASAVYAVACVLALAHVFRNADTSLRWDAHRLHKFNVYVIRACFWIVLLVGVVDATIALMRVENLFDPFMSEDTIRNMGISRFVGSYVHIPLIILGMVIALFTRTLGFTWLALMIVVAELLIVITRFVFSYEQALMGDLVRYWYAALFLFASAYTLYEDGHVRVDVLYSTFKGTTRGFLNAVGTILLGITTSWVILVIGLGSKQSIINAPVMNFEITQTGVVGMFVKYQMAAFLGVFAITMMIQFVSYFFEAWADRRDEPGHRAANPSAQ